VTTYAYDFNQNNIKITKPLGNTIEYDYDERNIRFATRVGGSAGSVTVQAFDGNGNLIDIVGPAQRGTSSQSLTVVISDAFNGTVNQSYTGDWVVQNIYDGFDRQIESTDAVGGTTQSTFDPGGRAIATRTEGTAGGTTPTDRSGSSNVPLASGSTRYDEAGRAYESQQDVFLNTGISGSTPVHILPSGRSVTQKGGGLAANHTKNNHATTVTLTSGGQSYVLSRMVYDRAGRTSVTATDNGALTTSTYDGSNRRLSTTDPLGNIIANTYDANSNVTGTTSIQKCTISSSIPTESFGALMLYDVMNQRVQSCGQGADGSLSSSLSDPNTLFTLTGYDSRGNKTNLIDPKQNTTVWKFDGASRNLENDQHLRTDGDGTNAIISTVTTKQAYDANSRLAKLTDSNGGSTTWAYDALDRQTKMTFHDGSTRLYGYDPANDVISYTDENQSVQARTFDPLGCNTAVSITLATGVQGTTAQRFQYDGRSRMTFSRDSVGSIDADTPFAFDSLSRVAEEAQTYGTDTRYVTHDEWKSLAATDMMYPSGRQISAVYDAIYRIDAINETSGGANIAHWQFFGNRTATVAMGNGFVTSYLNNAQTRSAVQYGQTTPAWGDISTDHLGYDGAGRLIGKRHQNGGGTTIVGNTSAYDKSGNKLFERALHAESRSNLYPGYDSMNRLLEYQRGTLASGGGSITTPISLPGTNQEQDYDLDALGNWSNTTITPEGGSPAVQTRTHNKLNAVTKYGSTNVHYDHGNNVAPHANRGNGNIADDGIRTYAYDALNRLTTVKRKSDGATIGQYTYDAIGRRIRKVVSNGGLSGTIANNIYRYISDGNQIVEELNGSNATTRQFVWGRYIDELTQVKTYVSTGSQPLAVGIYYLLSDQLYRSQALTNSSGTIVEVYDTDGYGNTLIYSGPGTDSTWFTDDDLPSLQPACETIYTGRQYDPESEIHFYRSRYYHSMLGRYISRDPLDYDMGTNLFEYVGSNPTERIDPTGEATVSYDVNSPQTPTGFSLYGRVDVNTADANGCIEASLYLAAEWQPPGLRYVKKLFNEFNIYIEAGARGGIQGQITYCPCGGCAKDVNICGRFEVFLRAERRFKGVKETGPKKRFTRLRFGAEASGGANVCWHLCDGSVTFEADGSWSAYLDFGFYWFNRSYSLGGSLATKDYVLFHLPAPLKGHCCSQFG
jgi:RHS repeat-associated protein